MGREIGQMVRERQRETERENDRNRGAKREIKGQRDVCEREEVGTDRDSETLERNRESERQGKMGMEREGVKERDRDRHTQRYS